jgi:hypothetical protein
MTSRQVLLVLMAMSQAAFAQFPPSVNLTLDQYGGDPRYSCPGGASGYFYTYQDPNSGHWWYCDPAGNRFFSVAVDVVDVLSGGKEEQQITEKLYGTGYRLCEGELPRLQAFGFNTVGVYSGRFFLPVETNVGAGCPVKMPFIYLITPSQRFKRNGLNRHFKDFVSTVGPVYTGYRGSSFADVWDPNWVALANYTGSNGPWGRSNPFPSMSQLDASPWLIGVSLDDSDEVWGTRGSGVNPHQPVTSWYAAVTPPVQVFSGRWQVLYPDEVMHVKQEWAKWLQGQTGITPGGNAIRSGSSVTLTFSGPHPFTIHDLLTLSGCSDSSFNTAPGHPVVVQSLTALSVTYEQPGTGSSAAGCTAAQGPGYTLSALNAAWGADYTTFGSSGKAVQGEFIALGDGSRTSFNHTLAHRNIDPFSVAIRVKGSLVGGDCPWFQGFANRRCRVAVNVGALMSPGSNLSGTINYEAGTMTINFYKAPPAGAQISVDYMYQGWPHQFAGGTGLLDEDGTNPWFPSDWKLSSLYSNSPPQVALDLDNFEDHLFQAYYQTLSSAVRALLPHHLVFSNDPIGPYDRPGVLRQAGRFCDVLIVGEGNSEQDVATYVYNVAHKPAQRYELIEGYQDSPLAPYGCQVYTGQTSSFPAWVCQLTQSDRGKTYYSTLQSSLNLKGGDGYGFVTGWSWWQMTDNASQMQNFGLLTFRDNAYDGVQDRIATSVDNFGYPRGGEPGNYGDFITQATAANILWLTNPPQQ